jgi:hypothetical protein
MKFQDFCQDKISGRLLGATNGTPGQQFAEKVQNCHCEERFMMCRK